MPKYRVKRGDSPASIAEKVYGSARAWQTVAESAPNGLRPGMTLNLPERWAVSTWPGYQAKSARHGNASSVATQVMFYDPGHPVRLNEAEEYFKIPPTVLRYRHARCEYCGCRGTIEDGYCSRCGGPEDVIVVE